MKTTIRAFALLGSLALLGTSTAALADLAGSVVRVKGTANATGADKKARPLTAGTEIHEGDVISTSKDSAVQLQMKDGALLAITDNSVVRVQSYNYEESNGDPDKVQIKLEKGRFRTITGDTPKSAYHLETPVALVSIKGTTYDVLVDTNTGETTVILRDGALTVEAKCDGTAKGDVQLLDVPGMAGVVTALCKDPEPAEDQNVADLQAILPLEEDDERCTDCNPPPPAPPASP